jgi:hypothetical protein
MKYREDYRKLHEQNAFGGMTLAHFAEPATKSLRYFGAKTVLDYGAGNGLSWEREPSLAAIRGDLEVSLYDPGVPKYETLPEGVFDAVLAFDVLEHVPLDEIDGVLKDIFSRAQKVVLMSFCPRGSKKKLPSTGEDVHVTQRGRDWWERRISHANLAYGHPVPWFLHENP